MPFFHRSPGLALTSKTYSPYLLGLAGAGLCTVFLLLSPWEHRLDTTALLYMAVVVAVTFFGGLGPGALTALVAFWLMNHNFLPPVGSLTFTHPGDVMAAVVFLGVAGLVSHLVNRSQTEATKAKVREHELSPTEYAILKVLAQHAGKILTHQALLHAVWGPTYGTEYNYLHVYIRRLRRKVERDPTNPRYLITEPGAGYRMHLE